MSQPSLESASPTHVSLATQLIVFLLAIVACVAGMTDLVAQWDREVATIQFLLMAVAPILWMVRFRRRPDIPADSLPRPDNAVAWKLAFLIGLTSIVTCFLVGRSMINLPPAYHDEYSYLFQSHCLLSGHLSVPSHPTNPELFDQMHVLNEGRMASRYYPGTGLWLLPFLAVGQPYWGQWIASAVASVFVFWTGHEIGNLRVATVSGLIFAISPGVALFGNLLLAHQPTVAALSLFMWAFSKWYRTGSSLEAWIAGVALSCAMLCRPATAAGFGLPFGIVFLIRLVAAKQSFLSSRKFGRFQNLLAMGLPILAGWLVMVAYNREVTGNWTRSPYQLYTDTYTPSHIYGFNNVLRAEHRKGPKVLDAYDRWAANLTPQLAAENTLNRLLASWLWTFDLLPQLISVIVVLGAIRRLDSRWIPIGLSIVTLHAIHIPYWYTGIMGWHYVFETVLPLSLFIGLATDLLLVNWRMDGRRLMAAWWAMLMVVSIAGNYVSSQTLMPFESGQPRITSGIHVILYPRRVYGRFNHLLESSVDHRPALVLIEIDPDDQHVDYIVNSPSLSDTILRARYVAGQTDIEAVCAAFPSRSIYRCRPKTGEIELLKLRRGA